METIRGKSGVTYTKKIKQDVSPTISVKWYQPGEILVEGRFKGKVQQENKSNPQDNNKTFLRFEVHGDTEIRKTDKDNPASYNKCIVKDGSEVMMWDTPDLSIKFRDIIVYSSVIVVYDGRKKGPNNWYNAFSVYVAE